MTYGKVTFRWGDIKLIAKLTEEGWKIPALPPLAGILESLANPSEFGPADGDPVACAVFKAAEILNGKGYVVPRPGAPPDAVY